MLYPASFAFGMLAALRRALYAHRIFQRQRLPVPVIVVGNITVGGTGKTPLVLWLTVWLQQHGYRPGIVTRGYGGSSTGPEAVLPESDPARCGDEAVLLASRAGCPVWMGRDRPAAGRGLLAAHPACDIVVSDDGLQHYALERDIEIAVLDGARGWGNGWLLPAGPLREPVRRLRSVDAIVVQRSNAAEQRIDVPAYAMRLTGRKFYNLLNREHQVGPDFFLHRSVRAIAGIGHPERFFRHLQQLGITFSARSYPDHYAFRAEDLAAAEADVIVMTEKDAVKCRTFANERHWALPVRAELDPALGELVLGKLRRTPGGS